MLWACPEDGGRLNSAGSTLVCSQCTREVTLEQGIPVFGERADWRAPAGPAAEKLDELVALLGTHGVEAAAQQFCSTHPCTRSLTGADWKFYVPLPAGGTLLELGAGFGDDTLALAGKATKTVSIVSNIQNALILKRHLGDAGHAAAAIAILRDGARLPLSDDAVDVIVLDELSAAALGINAATLGTAALEWKRVLKRGGTLFLGLGNPLHRNAASRKLLRAVQSRVREESLERYVKRQSAGKQRTNLRLGQTISVLKRVGFPTPTIHAPLPDEIRAQVVLPVDDKHVVRYFLNNLVRKNSFVTASALRCANVMNRMGLFRHLVPYYYVIFKLNSGEGSAGD